MSTLPSPMVVDDEEELARLFMEMLKGSGFNSVSFTDPLLALKHFSSNPDQYSIVITDLRMSGISGLKLAKMIRKYSANVIILLFTAFYVDEIINSNDFKEVNISKVI